MEGLYFYGFLWSVWIVSTFHLKRNSMMRFQLACLSLFAIIFSSYTFMFDKNLSVNFTSVFFIIIIFVKIGALPLKRQAHFLISSFILSIGYGTFVLFELFDPIWIIIEREWMLSCVLVYLAVLLQEKLLYRLGVILLGGVYGELLYAVVIHPFSFSYEIGSLPFLDICALCAALLLTWEGIKKGIGFIGSFYQSIEREKQKTT